MLRTFGISTSDFEFGNRLVPSYYYYSTIVKKENQQKGIKYLKFKDITSKISDGEHSHIPRNKTGGIRYLYGRNIKEGVINFDPISDDYYITEENYNKFKRCHISQNDILISIYGTIGKSAIYKEEYVGKAGIPRHISSITLKKDSPLTGEFITVFFRSKLGKRQLLNLTTGNIQQLLSLINIRQIDLPIPEKSFINTISSKEAQAIHYEIEALNLINKAKNYFYGKLGIDFSLIQKPRYYTIQLSEITKPDLWTPSFSNPLYINSIKTIKSKFEIVPLGDIVTIKKGDEVGSDQYIDFINKKTSDVPFIRTSDIINYEVDQFADYYIAPEIYTELNQDIQANDIIFTKDGKIGLTGLITETDKVIISSGISRLRIKKTQSNVFITPEYLFIVLCTKETGFYPAIRRTIVASTIPHLREERLKEVECPILDIASVNEISALVKEAFKLKDKRKQLVREITSDVDNYFDLI